MAFQVPKLTAAPRPQAAPKFTPEKIHALVTKVAQAKSVQPKARPVAAPRYGTVAAESHTGYAPMKGR